MLLENMSYCFGFRSLVIQLVTLEPVSGFPGNRFQGPGSAGRKTSSCDIPSFMHLKNVSFWGFPIVWDAIGHFGTGIRVFRRPVPGFGIAHSGVVSERSTYNWLLGARCPVPGPKVDKLHHVTYQCHLFELLLADYFEKYVILLRFPIIGITTGHFGTGIRVSWLPVPGFRIRMRQTLWCDISNFVISKEIPL